MGKTAPIVFDHELATEELAKAITDALSAGMTAEQAAKATYKVLCAAALAAGQNPDKEVFCWSPKKVKEMRKPRDTHWLVSWEAGPSDWAIYTSMHHAFPRLAEPYWSFDLCFEPSEWAQ